MQGLDRDNAQVSLAALSVWMSVNLATDHAAVSIAGTILVDVNKCCR